MKHLSLILIAFFIYTGCCTSKNSIENALINPSKTELPSSEKQEVNYNNLEKFNENTAIENSGIVESISKTILEPELMEKFDHSLWNDLLQKNVSVQGNVNYQNIKSEYSTLTSYINALAVSTPSESWSKSDILAYWINAYNALTVDLIIRNYPIKSIKDIKNPWDQRLWKLGEKWYNLDEIEHQIIRKMNEPRIHFALVCAAKSCPKLYNKAFTASNLENVLTTLTKEFLNDSSKNEISENTISLSKIFQWFSKDFDQNGSLIDFLNQYSKTKISPNAKKRFKDYNWDLNE